MRGCEINFNNLFSVRGEIVFNTTFFNSSDIKYHMSIQKTMISWLAKAFSFKNLLFFIASIDAIFESITNTSFECSVGIGITRHGRVSLHIFTFIALIKLTQLTNIFGWGLHALSSKNGSVSPSYSWLNLRLYQGSGVIRCIKFKKQFSTDITS